MSKSVSFIFLLDSLPMLYCFNHNDHPTPMSMTQHHHYYLFSHHHYHHHLTTTTTTNSPPPHHHHLTTTSPPPQPPPPPPREVPTQNLWSSGMVYMTAVHSTSAKCKSLKTSAQGTPPPPEHSHTGGLTWYYSVNLK